MRTATRTIVLRRHESQLIDGIDFQRDVPKVVDEELAEHLLALGNFQDLTGEEEAALAESGDSIDVGDILTQLEPEKGFIPKPLNELGTDDLNGKRLLFRRKGGIGDLVVLGMVCQVIKNKFPGCYIHVGVQENNLEIPYQFDAIDKVTTLDATTLVNVAHSFHYVVNFNGVLGSELAGAADDKHYFRAHFERAGWGHEVPEKMPHLSINKLIGNLAVQSDANDVLNEIGFGDHDYVVLLLGTSNPLKRMTPQTLQLIAENLSSPRAKREGRERIRVLALGGENDRIFHPSTPWIHVETDLPYPTTFELVRRARCVVGADTGFLHFAAAIGAPVVGAWGPTVPDLGIGNYDADQRHVVADDQLECAPCKILRSAHCKHFDGGYAKCMRLKVEADIPELVHELLEANPDHSARSIDPSEVQRVVGEEEGIYRVALLLDYAKTYTGGGFYMWQTAKMLSELPKCHVTVFADVPQDKLPYLQTDIISYGDRISIVFDKDLQNWQSSDPFDLVVAQPPACGGAAVKYAKERGSKSLLVVYETPNYIAQYRKGQDAGNKYWHDYHDALDSADYIWTISQPVFDCLHEWMPQLKDKGTKVDIIHPVVNAAVADKVMADNDEFYSHKTETVVMIARNMSYKKLRETLHSLGDTLCTQLNRKLTIVVIGDRVKRLDKHVQPAWKAKVKLLENVPEEEKWEWLNQAKLIVHPSEFEGFGIPVAEGLYAGAHVLARPLPVLKQCFENQAQYYSDEQELVTKAVECFNDWDNKDREDGTGPHTEARIRHDFVGARYTKTGVSTRISKALRSTEGPEVTLDDQSLRIAYVGPWNTKCGIADTTQQFVAHLSKSVHVFSNKDQEPLKEDTNLVTRCWERSFTNYKPLLAQLLDYQPHIVHIEHEHSLFQKNKTLLEFMRKCREKGMKVVITLHTYQPSRFTDELREVADAIITTKNVGEDGWDVIDLPVPPIERIGRTEALEALNVSDRKYIVGSFGMWQVHKGYSEFIETYGKVASKVGENLQYLVSAAAPLKHQHLVETRRKFKIQVDNGQLLLFNDYPALEDAVNRLEACSTLVFNYNVAHWTSASAAIRTGMSAGVPIVCTESPMFSEFEHNKHVLKVSFGDANALSDAILRLWTHGELREKLVANCDEYLRGCVPSEIARKHEELYHRLVFGDDKGE